MAPFTHRDTRETVYADPADLPRLRNAQRLRGQLRGVFARTERPRRAHRRMPRRRSTRGGDLLTEAQAVAEILAACTKRKREPSGLPFVHCAYDHFRFYSTMLTRLARG